ncbi:MAG: aminoacyl-tRNA hydrolase [Sphaerochaetaceae bacterium]|nr:aminoacyl-tRNA hydrolase [Sphaerochaetaceae bacterium]
MPKLIVFLGNPGIQYRQTRHNAGWIACDHLLKTRHITDTWQTKFHALYTKQGNTILLKPQTFMNVSGVSVQEAAKFYNIQNKDILVVHDDIELPFGTTKIQLGGGMGGHNGLRSIKQNLGTDQFMRLRIGVGRPPAVMQVADYVLGRFSPLEEKQLESTLDSISESIVQYMST